MYCGNCGNKVNDSDKYCEYCGYRLEYQYKYEEKENIEKELKIRKFCTSRRKYELENAICVAKLIIIAALKRENSIGAHYRADVKKYELNNKELSNDKILVK